MNTSSLAATVVSAFLYPALSADWREKWKGINRAAGIIAGWSLTNGGVAEVESVITTAEALFGNKPAHVQLTDGLRKRVAEILVLMEP